MSQRVEDAPTPPLLLRVAVVLQLFLLLIPLGFLLQWRGPRTLLGALPLLLEAAMLMGIWRMRRWGVVGYALLLGVGVLVALWGRMEGVTPGGGVNGLFVALVLGGAVLIPAGLYWKRMI